MVLGTIWQDLLYTSLQFLRMALSVWFFVSRETFQLPFCSSGSKSFSGSCKQILSLRNPASNIRIYETPCLNNYCTSLIFSLPHPPHFSVFSQIRIFIFFTPFFHTLSVIAISIQIIFTLCVTFQRFSLDFACSIQYSLFQLV